MEWEARDLPENNVTDVHPLKELATLVVGIAIATVVLTLLVAAVLDLGVRMLPTEWEARLFSGLWTEMEADEDERLASAGALLERLGTHWPENPYDLQLFIIDSEDPNAFALPGGAIGVTQGLLDSVDSENELAFVLAHELGHFNGRHHLRGISRSIAITMVLAAVTGGSSGTLLTQWVAEITQLGFAREHEREADRFGLEIVADEYRHVGGATHFFEKLGEIHADAEASPMGAWLSTHPISPERVSAMKRLAHQRHWRVEGDLTALDPSFGAR